MLCIILGCKKNDDTRITLAVDDPVWDLNPCTIFGSHEGMVDSKYNLIRVVLPGAGANRFRPSAGGVCQ
jgi:hypothetical protein